MELAELKKDFLFLLDLDGTIITPGQEIDREMVNNLRFFNESLSLLITTARHSDGVKFVFQNHIDFIPTISLNGGGLHLNSWDKFDKVVYLTQEFINEIISVLRYYPNIICNYYTKDYWYVSEITHIVLNESKVTGIKPLVFSKTIEQKCIKILLMGTTKELSIIQNIVRQKFRENAISHFSNKNYLEINSSKTNKAFFVKDFLKKIRQIDRKDITILFVGDSENDIDCAKYANHSWTFDYAPQDLKKYCSLLTLSNSSALKTLLTKFRR